MNQSNRTNESLNHPSIEPTNKPTHKYTRSFVRSRFTASFLESESSVFDDVTTNNNYYNRLDASHIGVILAAQRFVGIFAGSFTGILADHLEKKYPSRGRLLVLGAGCCLGSLVFGMHGIHRLLVLVQLLVQGPGQQQQQPHLLFFQSLPWFVILRMVYAISTSLMFPVLDGICLDFLKKQQQFQQQQLQQKQQLTRESKRSANNANGNDKSDDDGDCDASSPPAAATDDYGKERLYGAIAWGLTNLVIGPTLDYYHAQYSQHGRSAGEFWVLYPMALVSTILLLVAIWIYAMNTTNNIHDNINKSVDANVGVNNSSIGRVRGQPPNCDSDILSDSDSSNYCKDGGDYCCYSKKGNNEGKEMENAGNGNFFRDEPTGSGYSDSQHSSGRYGSLDLDLELDHRSCSTSVGDDDTNGTKYETSTKTSSTCTTTGGTGSNLRYYWSIFTTTFGASVYTVAFLVCLVALSSGQAIVSDLVFLFFESALSSSYTFMSLSVLLTVSFEIPIFQIAPFLLQRLGTNALLIVASVSYVVRVVGYSLVPANKAWVALLLEPLHGITYACCQTAGVDFVSTKLDFGSFGSNKYKGSIENMDSTNTTTTNSNYNGSNSNDNNSSTTNGPDNNNKNLSEKNDSGEQKPGAIDGGDTNGNIGNDGMEATGQGFLQLFVGLGSVLGLVFGGYAEDSYGPRVMYRMSALVVSIGCLWLVAVLVCSSVAAATIVVLARKRIRHNQALVQTKEGAELILLLEKIETAEIPASCK